jgi:hypothetical protein
LPLRAALSMLATYSRPHVTEARCMAKKSKKFRIATEGATVDGRTIQREWIAQMAEHYDPAKYRATINLEHIRGVLPDGPFRNYGFVDALSQVQNADGKLELFAEISPTDDLVGMTKKGQKVFTSIEVNPKFADTGKAYLVGLAVTDNPASLGTEMLQFAASNPDANPFAARKLHPDNHFSAAVETVIEFVDEPEAKPGVLAKIRELFARKNLTDDARFADIEAALEEVAEHGEAQSAQTARQFEQVDTEIKASRQQLTDMSSRVAALEQLFNTTPAAIATRPLATGTDDALTDF